MHRRRASVRASLVTGLVLSGSLALAACGATDPAPASSAAPAPSSSSAPAPSSSPASSPKPAPASTSSTSSAPSKSPSASAAAPSSDVSSATATPADASATEAAEECSGLSGAEALQAAVDEGYATPYSDMALHGADYSSFDDCAALSAVVLTLGNGGLPGMEIQLFHHGLPVGPAPEAGLSTVVSPLTRVDDETLQATFLFAYPNESMAAASGRAVSTYAWDDSAGEVTRSGELPPSEGAAPAAPATPAPASTSSSAAEGLASSGLLNHSGDAGFCFYGPERITCFGKHNNSATLKATGPATLSRDVPSMGFEDPSMTSTTLAPGESATVGGFECEATAAGFTCTSPTSGAGFTVEGPEMSATPPTR